MQISKSVDFPIVKTRAEQRESSSLIDTYRLSHLYRAVFEAQNYLNNKGITDAWARVSLDSITITWSEDE